MIEITCLEDITALRESIDIECKLAQGRDGKGALPIDIWETYSAFANTRGGDIVLGLKEKKDGSFELKGIEKPQRVLDDLWSTIDNKQKASINILRERWVEQIVIDGKTIIRIHVPQATRKQKPVYIKGNPLTGTYKRLRASALTEAGGVVDIAAANAFANTSGYTTLYPSSEGQTDYLISVPVEGTLSASEILYDGVVLL